MSTYQIGRLSADLRPIFRLTRPERYNWGPSTCFDRWGRRSGASWPCVGSAMPEMSRKVTFREFSRTSTRFANALAGLGVGNRESGVFVMLPRVVEWWGGPSSGGIRGPGSSACRAPRLLRHKDIVYRINASGASVAVDRCPPTQTGSRLWRPECPSVAARHRRGREPRFASAMRDLLAKSFPPVWDSSPESLHRSPHDLLHVGGPTGNRPKMVVNDHASYPKAHVITGKFWLDNRPHRPPLDAVGHGMGPSRLDLPVRAPGNMGGGDLHLGTTGGRFDAERTLRMLHEHPITTFFAPPTALPDAGFSRI